MCGLGGGAEDLADALPGEALAAGCGHGVDELALAAGAGDGGSLSGEASLSCTGAKLWLAGGTNGHGEEA